MYRININPVKSIFQDGIITGFMLIYFPLYGMGENIIMYQSFTFILPYESRAKSATLLADYHLLILRALRK